MPWSQLLTKRARLVVTDVYVIVSPLPSGHEVAPPYPASIEIPVLDESFACQSALCGAAPTLLQTVQWEKRIKRHRLDREDQESAAPRDSSYTGRMLESVLASLEVSTSLPRLNPRAIVACMLVRAKGTVRDSP